MAHIRLQDRHTHEQMFTNKDLLVHQSSADAIRRATITHRNTRTHTYSLSLPRAHVCTNTHTHNLFHVYTHQHTTRAHAITYTTQSLILSRTFIHLIVPSCKRIRSNSARMLSSLLTVVCTGVVISTGPPNIDTGRTVRVSVSCAKHACTYYLPSYRCLSARTPTRAIPVGVLV